MTKAAGGCLCGKLRYQVANDPGRVTICHCKFCQRATGGAYMVEPIFDLKDLEVTKGRPKTYTHLSQGSGKEVYVHFCETCGTKLFLNFERFADVAGVYAGTFDDPDWFDVNALNAKHIYLGEAQRGTVIPADINTFSEHAFGLDGSDNRPTVFAAPKTIGQR